MRLSRTIGFIALLPIALCLPPIAAAQTAVPSAAKTKGKAVDTLPDRGEITLFQSKNRVMVMMRIGDGELVPMIFDTGSDGHSIDRMIARREHFKKVGTAIEVDGTTGKERKLPFVAMPGISIGGLRVGTIDASVLDYDRSDAMGIISSEMFTSSLLYLDLANGRARLVPREGADLPLGPATPYVRDIPSVDIVMPDGSKLPAHFDTGYNAALSLPISLMDKVPLMAPARVVGRFKSINTEGEVYGGQIRGTIKIGPVVLENPEVSFLGDLANIGLPVIRQVTLVIDPVADRNWVLPSGAVPGGGK